MRLSIAGCIGSRPHAIMRPKIATFRARSTDVTETLGMQGVLLVVVQWSGRAEVDAYLWLSIRAPHSTMNDPPVRKEYISLPHLTRLILHPWRLTDVTIEARSNVLSFRQAGYAGPCRGLGLRCDSAAQW